MQLTYKNTQAYTAGVLTAKLYIMYNNRTDLPSVLLCMRDFQHLTTIFGKYYSLLKLHKTYSKYILRYETFTEQLIVPNIERGGINEFMLGYCDNIKPLIKKEYQLY